MTPKQVAALLRIWLNDNRLTLSDLRKAQIHLLNGTLGDSGNGIGKGEARKRDQQAYRKPDATTRMNKGFAHVEFVYAPPADDFKGMKKYLAKESC